MIRVVCLRPWRDHWGLRRGVPGAASTSYPAGHLRVRVYAGQDPVSKRRHDLIEIIPPGPDADKEARRVRDRLISQVEERRTREPRPRWTSYWSVTSPISTVPLPR